MTEGWLPWVAAVLVAVPLIIMLRGPLKLLLRLTMRSSVGLALLALFSQVGQGFGITVGVNLVNALVVGMLGVPGFGLLLMMQWALR